MIPRLPLLLQGWPYQREEQMKRKKKRLAAPETKPMARREELVPPGLNLELAPLVMHLPPLHPKCRGLAPLGVT